MKKYKLYLLSLASAILLTISWPFIGNLSPLLLVSFVPLLFLEDFISINKKEYKNYHIFNYSLLSFLTWNILTTWWVYYASSFGAFMAIFWNSTFMATVFLLFHISKKRLGQKAGYASLIFYWIAFEYLHLNWDLSWPWLTLGNGFANLPELVQWYEYTGILGGSLWILLSNILLFQFIKKIIIERENIKSNFKRVLYTDALIILPIIFSLMILGSFKEEENPIDVILVQPNIDPYNEKYNISSEEQLNRLFILGTQELDTAVEYLIFPETSLPDGLWENNLGESEQIQKIKHFLKPNPKINLLAGLSSYKAYQQNEKPSGTARKFRNMEGYYDAYNTAIQIDSSSNIQLYHKSKLVPGVEQTPFPSLFGNLEFLAIDLGGIVGSLGTDKERKVFSSNNSEHKAAPVICYESIYGEFVGEYVKNGANFICVITNDGWWGDTPGYKQHMNYARLRAIETRKSVARSANTGISCFINQKGEIEARTEWWKPSVLRGKINASNKITFYVQYGDYIGRIASFIAFLIILWVIAKSLNKTEQRLGN